MKLKLNYKSWSQNTTRSFGRLSNVSNKFRRNEKAKRKSSMISGNNLIQDTLLKWLLRIKSN